MSTVKKKSTDLAHFDTKPRTRSGRLEPKYSALYCAKGI